MRAAIFRQADRLLIPRNIDKICGEPPGIDVVEIVVLDTGGALDNMRGTLIRWFGLSAIARLGLRIAWFVYRGDGATVSFDPPQFKHFPDFKRGSPWTRGWEPPPLSEDGKHPVQVTFSEPGRFVLRVLAHDGGSASSADVTVAVTTAGP